MIAIVNYNASNLASVKKAFGHLQAESCITGDPEVVQRASKIVLPGVGHFSATRSLADSGLRECIASSIRRGVPFLGICVGMQWMLAGSEEAAGAPGLGLWPQECQRFPAHVKSPHVGWNSLKTSDHASRLLAGVPDGAFVYFTHSYRVPLMDATTAQAEYGGRFSAAIERDNVFGVQFHPEKSDKTGLRILRNFCQC